MKNTIVKSLSVILSVMIMITALPLVGIDFSLQADAKTISQYKVGDIIEFGSYPQSKVTDSTLISSLNSLSKTWVSYGYYTGTGDWDDGNMQPGDFMKYADVTYNGAKYRAVTFTQYRPYITSDTSSTDNTAQDDNGYYTNTLYWFKYEPLEWRVLDPDEGFVMCESIIDSQPYNNTVYYNGNKYYQDKTCTNYANDYATSSIREWLNNDFYNTAFTSAEKTEIQKSRQDNSCPDDSAYDSDTTYDKIFLLSYDEAKNSACGFSSSGYEPDTAREAQGTDYAKVQGLWVDTSSPYYGNSWWWLRSPYYSSYYACGVYSGGSSDDSFNVGSTDIGVRPALKINPQSDIDNIDKPEIGDSDIEINDSDLNDENTANKENWSFEEDTGTLEILDDIKEESYDKDNRPWEKHIANIKIVVIHVNVTKIPESAFEDCTELEKVTIPKTVKEIGRNSFKNCGKIKNLYYEGTKSDWDKIEIGSNNSILDSVKIKYNSKNDNSSSITTILIIVTVIAVVIAIACVVCVIVIIKKKKIKAKE